MDRRETEQQAQARALLEKQTREIAAEVKSMLPPGKGFILFAFDFGEGGNMAYASNAQRADVMKALVEWKEKSAS